MESACQRCLERRLNAGPRSETPRLSSEAKARVRAYYAADFERFGYR